MGPNELVFVLCASLLLVLGRERHQQRCLVKWFIYYKAYAAVESDEAGSLIRQVRGAQP